MRTTRHAGPGGDGGKKMRIFGEWESERIAERILSVQGKDHPNFLDEYGDTKV